MESKDKPWGIPQWTNVLKKKGCIDPNTIRYAEQRLHELRVQGDGTAAVDYRGVRE